MDADALYGLPLEEFTAQRTALARSLRAQGDREGAAEVAALRKPTLVAWTVNQLARRHPREVDLLLDASHRLIAAQTGATAQDVVRAINRQREAIAGLIAHAHEILGSRASGSTLTRLNETLRAASLTAEGRELLAQGTLDREMTSTGWDLLAASATAASPGRPKHPSDEEEAARKKEVALARRAVKQARTRRDEAQRRLEKAQAERDRLEQKLEAAQETEGEARKAVIGAEETLAAAESHLTDAEAEYS